LPILQLENVQNDGKFTRIIVEVHCEANISWGDSYDMRTFELGTGQEVVVEKTTQQ